MKIENEENIEPIIQTGERRLVYYRNQAYYFTYRTRRLLYEPATHHIYHLTITIFKKIKKKSAWSGKVREVFKEVDFVTYKNVAPSLYAKTLKWSRLEYHVTQTFRLLDGKGHIEGHPPITIDCDDSFKEALALEEQMRAIEEQIKNEQ